MQTPKSFSTNMNFLSLLHFCQFRAILSFHSQKLKLRLILDLTYTLNLICTLGKVSKKKSRKKSGDEAKMSVSNMIIQSRHNRKEIITIVAFKSLD